MVKSKRSVKECMNEKLINERIIEMYGSRQAFAEHIGISKSTVTRMFQFGIDHLQLGVAIKMAAGLNLTVDEFANVSHQDGVDKMAARKMYEHYSARPEVQAAVDKLLEL